MTRRINRNSRMVGDLPGTKMVEPKHLKGRSPKVEKGVYWCKSV